MDLNLIIESVGGGILLVTVAALWFGLVLPGVATLLLVLDSSEWPSRSEVVDCYKSMVEDPFLAVLVIGILPVVTLMSVGGRG